MRYSKSMIEAVKQVGLYEALDYAIVDGDNKIIGLYKGNMAKKHAQMNMKGAERQVGIKKPLKICLLYTSPSPRDATLSRMPSSA